LLGGNGAPLLPLTANDTPLLARLFTVTTIGPVVAPAGTVTVNWPFVHPVAAAANVPLNVTVLVPCGEPKFVPITVIELFIAPCDAESATMLGPGVKLTPLLGTPPAETMTLPGVAPIGTGATMLFDIQLVGAESVPLNDTAPATFDGPKPDPVIVMGVLTFAVEAESDVMIGATTFISYSSELD